MEFGQLDLFLRQVCITEAAGHGIFGNRALRHNTFQARQFRLDAPEIDEFVLDEIDGTVCASEESACISGIAHLHEITDGIAQVSIDGTGQDGLKSRIQSIRHMSGELSDEVRGIGLRAVTRIIEGVAEREDFILVADGIADGVGGLRESDNEGIPPFAGQRFIGEHLTQFGELVLQSRGIRIKRFGKRPEVVVEFDGLPDRVRSEPFGHGQVSGLAGERKIIEGRGGRLLQEHFPKLRSCGAVDVCFAEGIVLDLGGESRECGRQLGIVLVVVVRQQDRGLVHQCGDVCEGAIDLRGHPLEQGRQVIVIRIFDRRVGHRVGLTDVHCGLGKGVVCLRERCAVCDQIGELDQAIRHGQVSRLRGRREIREGVRVGLIQERGPERVPGGEIRIRDGADVVEEPAEGPFRLGERPAGAVQIDLADNGVRHGRIQALQPRREIGERLRPSLTQECVPDRPASDRIREEAAGAGIRLDLRAEIANRRAKGRTVCAVLHQVGDRVGTRSRSWELDHERIRGPAEDRREARDIRNRAGDDLGAKGAERFDQHVVVGIIVIDQETDDVIELVRNARELSSRLGRGTGKHAGQVQVVGILRIWRPLLDVQRIGGKAVRGFQRERAARSVQIRYGKVKREAVLRVRDDPIQGRTEDAPLCRVQGADGGDETRHPLGIIGDVQGELVQHLLDLRVVRHDRRGGSVEDDILTQEEALGLRVEAAVHQGLQVANGSREGVAERPYLITYRLQLVLQILAENLRRAGDGLK